MNDPFLVRCVERVGNLARDCERLWNRQWPARQPIGERGALDQFKHQCGHAIGFFQSVDRADVRVIQRGEQPRFARETGPAFGVELKCDGRILIATSRPSLRSRAR